MKSNPDHDELLQEVFSEAVSPAFREASLNRALASVRRRRTGRRVLGATLVLAVVVAVVARFGSGHRNSSSSPGPSAIASVRPPAVQTVPGTKIRLVDDDELLAMFPDRPVALVGPPEHRQFVFLDDARLRLSEEGGRRKGLKL